MTDPKCLTCDPLGTSAISEICLERRQQAEVHVLSGATLDALDQGQLANAASLLLWRAEDMLRGIMLPPWPFDEPRWQPGSDYRHNLVKAAAFITAEIERVDRAPTEAKDDLQ